MVVTNIEDDLQCRERIGVPGRAAGCWAIRSRWRANCLA